MDKSVLGIVAAIAALTPLTAAHATAVSSQDAAAALRVSSIAELLEPVANAPAILAALSADQNESAPTTDKGVQLAWHHHHHHHHWHHHHWHHHHWHHHHWWWHHHHHHHHWHHHHWHHHHWY